jgi:hypothetical protein
VRYAEVIAQRIQASKAAPPPMLLT